MQTIAMDLIQIAIKNVFMSWTRELSEWQRAKMQTINLPSLYKDFFETFFCGMMKKFIEDENFKFLI